MRKSFPESLTPLAVGLILSLACGRSFGYFTIDRKVDEAEFWRAPLGNDSFRSQAWGNQERYAEHQGEIELQLTRLGIPSNRVSFFIRDFYRWTTGEQNEDYSFRFPSRTSMDALNIAFLSSFLSKATLNHPFPFALKIFSSKKGVLVRPYDTDEAAESSSSSPAVASLPDGFFKRNGKIGSHEEPIHIGIDGGFHAGDGFIFFFFFPAPVCADNKDSVLLIRCRFWQHQDPRELIFQAIDPELKLSETSYTPADLRREVAGEPNSRTAIFVRELETTQGRSYRFFATNECDEDISSFNAGGANQCDIPNGDPTSIDQLYLTVKLQALANFYRFPKKPEALALFWPCGQDEELFRRTNIRLPYSGDNPRYNHLLVLKDTSQSQGAASSSGPESPDSGRAASPQGTEEQDQGSGGSSQGTEEQGQGPGEQSPTPPPQQQNRGVDTSPAENPSPEEGQGGVQGNTGERPVLFPSGMSGRSYRLEELPHELRFVPLSLHSVTNVCGILGKIQLTLQNGPWETTLREMESFYHCLQEHYGILDSYDRRTATISENNIIHVIRVRCERAIQLLDQLQQQIAELKNDLQTYHDENSPNRRNSPRYRMNGSCIRH
ncbi:MAG: hypothetical protein LBD54_01020 [Puniceicoccales bacterium]|nr:hypothetical protein [Puniceicoccales bacterium]